jgi:hypothetical protein
MVDSYKSMSDVATLMFDSKFQQVMGSSASTALAVVPLISNCVSSCNFCCNLLLETS